MAKEIHVPDIGDFADVDVIEVLVNVGDTIAIDDPMITLESDKASMDIPAPEGGVVQEVKVKVGDQVSEGSVVLLLAASDEPSVNVAVDDAQPTISRGAAASPSGAGNGGSVLEDIVVPDIGDFSGVDVIEVLVAVGDTVKEDDALITLESDKASMDVPSPKGGVVKEVKIAVGDQASEGSLILVLETAGSGSVATASEAAAPEAQASGGSVNKAPERVPDAADSIDAEAFRRAHASPSVRRMARELGVNLALVMGTGRNGRITPSDVQHFKNTGGPVFTEPAPVAPEAVAQETGKAASAAESGIPVITQPDWSKFGTVNTIPMGRISKLSAAHLHKAWLNVPQVTHFDEVDISSVEAYRQEMKGRAKEMGFGLTPLVFMMKAVVAALKEFPKFNSAMDDAHENLIQREFYHIGIAVDTPDGLVVPVIRDVDRKGAFELARELGEVSLRAREGKLKSVELQGGCFTISSLGGIGGTNFTPIVNAPEVGILGLTRSKVCLARVNGEIVDQLIQPLAVSYDHRVIDGAYAARFVGYIAFILSDVRNLII